MPELPEVETVARTLAPHVTGSVITGALLMRPSTLHPLSLPPEKLCGHIIGSVGRRGKLLLLHLEKKGSFALPESNVILAVHLRMTGRLSVLPADALPEKHTRCIFQLSHGGTERKLFFDDIRAFGQIFAAVPENMARWDFWRTLGPEPLEVEKLDFCRRLRKRGTSLKAALLDQKLVAGIGNIYADELLFMAGISPLRRASALDVEECGRVWRAMRAILRKAIAQCGSSIRDYRDANGHAGAFQNSFAVYGRGQKACVRCGNSLEKIRLAGRSTVYCPVCQK